MAKTGFGADKTVIKSMGFCSFGSGSNTAEIDVKDGKILRTRPLRFDREYKLEGKYKPWEIEVKGKTFKASKKSLLPPFAYAYKKRAYSPNRVPYPMKRVDWDPEGERNPQNRGISKFERISWDEALDIIAKEIKRQYEKYGVGSILVQQDGHGETKVVHGPHGCQTRLLDLMGGCTVQARQPDSWEGWYWGAKHVWGMDHTAQGIIANLFYDISKNTKMLLCWGCDPETTPWGWGGQMPSQMSFWFNDIGIKTIYICPDLNYAAAIHAGKWIPVLPNTDLALQWAIVYVWLTEDLYDKEFIKSHTIGFEYVEKVALGEDDGIVKTPEWAEKICGVPARIIKALARKWHREATTIAHCNGGSFIRSCYAHEPGRMEVVLLAMQGLGKPGRNQFKFIEWGMMGLEDQVPTPKGETMYNCMAAYNGGKHGLMERIVPKTLVPQAILSDETLTWYGHCINSLPTYDQYIYNQFPKEEGDPRIHMIWTDTPCWTTCWNGGNLFIEALRSDRLDFVLAQHPWLENDCLFADIILPVSTKYELEDIGMNVGDGSYYHLYYEGRAIDRVGESLSDWEIACEVAKRLGLYEEYTRGRDVEKCIRDGFENSGAQNEITYEEFREKEYIISPTAEDWESVPAGFYNFYIDPEKHPLNTPSGKLEIFCANLQEYFPDDEERKPYPQYIASGETHPDENLQAERAKKYPFLIVSNHPKWRVHANMDDISWFREIPTCKVTGPDGYKYEPVWINPVDAEKLGIKSGDVVKIFNERGWVLGGAYVTHRIMPGVVLQDHGARLDPIEPGVSDRGGANNLIAPSKTTSKNCVGEVTSGYLVGVEKVDVHELVAQYPDAFNRKFEESGVCLENRIK
ncbi:MAG: molybdopterin-dependent oxidoreductase [Peptococcaceae bacterium]|nr:molybdopterin-dependent oxidoreductase [Peptococcaceae bacterium]